jgi:WD40 repeat protein
MASFLEITIQRRSTGCWPVVTEDHRPDALLPIRSNGELELPGEPPSTLPREYGVALGKALFRNDIYKALVRARTEGHDGSTRVLVFVEDEKLKAWRWEWLCAPLEDGRWDFLSLDQRALFSLYLPSCTDRAYPPIGRHDLRALLVVANPGDPERKYRLEPFDPSRNVALLQVFGPSIPCDVLARVSGAVGAPSLDALLERLTASSSRGPYTILHIVCHGWLNPEGETVLYFEQPTADLTTGEVAAQPVTATRLIEELSRVRHLPYLIFLSSCESAKPEAEQRLGGLAQRLVRELGVPAVIGMTERVTIPTAHALAEAFYTRLLAQEKVGEVDRALVEAYAGLANRPDVNVPALYSRLGAQPLFSIGNRESTPNEIQSGLERFEGLIRERAPGLQPQLEQTKKKLLAWVDTDITALSSAARKEYETALKEVNELCQDVVEISFDALAQGQQPPVYDSRQPFRGMSPFRFEDREFFFGREALIDKLERKLAEDNFLPVLGPSGSGKSSLVLAGLAPRLKQQVAGLQVIEGLTPGSTPLERLQAPQANLAPGPVLYVVDQFEELFTLCKDKPTRQAFIAKLLELAQSQRVVLTMRADFWGECAIYTGLRNRMQSRQELVAPMTAEELRAAVEQQAAKVGLRFEADLSNTMIDEVESEPGAMPLLQHALLELWKRRHGRWLRTSEYRALGGVKEAIAKTADGLYDGLSKPQQEQVRDIFVRLTRLDEDIIQGEQARDTRRRLSLSELVPEKGDPEQTKDLMNCLADEGLAVTSRNPVTQQEEYEIAHEALIRHWDKLRGWLEEGRDVLRLRQGISEAAADWRKGGRESSLLVHRGRRLQLVETMREQGALKLSSLESEYIKGCRRHRDAQRRMFIAGFAIVLITVFGLAIWALAGWRAESQQARNAEDRGVEAAKQRDKAEQQKIAAQEQARIAETRRLSAESSLALTRYPERGLLLAVEAVRVAETLSGERPSAAENSLREALNRVGGWPLRGTNGPFVTSVAISSHWVVTGSNDGTVRLWDLTAKNLSGGPVVLGPNAAVEAVAISPNNHWLVAGSFDGTARLWDLTAKDPSAHPVVLLPASEGAEVKAVAISPNNHWLVAGSFDGTARLWDLTAKDPTAHPVVLLPPSEGAEVKAVTISSDNHWLVIGSYSGVRLWDLTAKDPAAHSVVLGSNEGEQVNAVAISPNNHWVVTGGYDGARLWNFAAKDPSAHAVVLEGDKIVNAVAISSDNHWAVTGSHEGTVCLWDLTAKDPSAHPVVLGGNEEAGVDAVAISPNDHWLVTGSYDGAARLWDLTAKDPAASPVVLRGHEDVVLAVAISSDNHWVITASQDGTARLWNLTAKDPSTQFVLGGNEESGAVAISPNNHWLVSGSNDGGTHLWDLTAKDPSSHHVVLGGNEQAGVNAVAISPDNHWVVTGSNDGAARLWDLTAKDPADNPVVLRGDGDLVLFVAISSDNHWVVTASLDGTACLWDLTAKDPTAHPVVLLPPSEGAEVKAVTISSDNHWLVIGSYSGVRLWDLTAKDPAAHSVVLGSNEGEQVNAVAISPNNHWVVTGSDDGAARLWDLTAKDPTTNPVVLRTNLVFRGNEEQWKVLAVAISSDNHWLVTGNQDGSARLWDLTVKDPSAQPVALRANEDAVCSVAISQDNHWLLTGSYDGMAYLWDLTAKAPAANPVVLPGLEKESVYALAISPDDHWVVIGSRASESVPRKGTVRLWPVQVNHLIDRAREVVGRNFTMDEWQRYFPDEKYHKTFTELPGPK